MKFLTMSSPFYKTCLHLFFLAGMLYKNESSMAQKQHVKNLMNYDRQLFHFGFTLGVNNMDFAIRRNMDAAINDSVYVIESKAQSGFNLGIISNMRLAEFLDLRFIPALSFAQRTLTYTFANTQVPKVVESTFLEFPLDVKFKSYRLNNGRAYVLGGAKLAYDLASQKSVEEEKNIVKLDRYDYYWEIGFGLDFYLHYFKFAPEIKIGYGINNTLVATDNAFTNPISRLSSKVVLVSFNFE